MVKFSLEIWTILRFISFGVKIFFDMALANESHDSFECCLHFHQFIALLPLEIILPNEYCLHVQIPVSVMKAVCRYKIACAGLPIGLPLCIESGAVACYFVFLACKFDVPVDNPGGDPLTERRADFGFSGGARTILVDCTTISPLAKIIKDYKPGKAADYATKRKEKYYQRFLDIKTTDRCAIFFFAVETSGGLGREARNYVKMLAKLSGDRWASLSCVSTRRWPWKSKLLGPIKSTSRRISR
jgi:hypothetical protein